MDEKEMKSFLDKTGLPVAYSHFSDNQKPPFLCFLSNKKAEGSQGAFRFFNCIISVHQNRGLLYHHGKIPRKICIWL